MRIPPETDLKAGQSWDGGANGGINNNGNHNSYSNGETRGGAAWLFIIEQHV